MEIVKHSSKAPCTQAISVRNSMEDLKEENEYN